MPRQLGPLAVHPIGFGTWGLGGAVQGAPLAYGATDDGESLQALQTATELGINFFDTSGLYGLGHAERLLARGLPPRALIAGKAGYVSAEGAQDFSASHLRQELEASLERLGRARLDLFQLHDPLPDQVSPKLWQELQNWKKAGLIRALGISVRKPADALVFMQEFELDSVQLNYNLTDQRARCEGVLQACARRGVGVIARTPLCFGFLGNQLPTTWSADDHRSRWSDAQREAWRNARDLFGGALGKAYAGSEVQLALAFCLAYPEISVVIPGMLTDAQVRENVASLENPLEPDQVRVLEEVYEGHSFFVRR